MEERNQSHRLENDKNDSLSKKHRELRCRPKNLPFPEILNDISQYEGHISTDYWMSEDAVFLHPPREGVVCAILRKINFGEISDIAAAVMAPKQHGPALSMGIGIAPSGHAGSENWEYYMGEKVQVFPNCWGIVQAHNDYVESNNIYDILLSAQVIGRQGNENAWATFRRFSFSFSV